MFRLMTVFLMVFLLTSCSYLQIRKQEIEQGNIITPDLVAKLHPGMSESQVRHIMGSPMLTNIFTPDRIEYIYTLQKRDQSRQQKMLSCIFQRGRLVTIQKVGVL